MKYILLIISPILLLLLNASKEEFSLIEPIAVENAPPVIIIPVDDKDGDGVYSDKDKCLNTQKGAKVGDDGCKLKSIIVLVQGKKKKTAIIVETQTGRVVIDKPNYFVSIKSKRHSPTKPKHISKKDLGALFGNVISSNTLKQLNYVIYFNGIDLIDESKIRLQNMLDEIAKRDNPYIKITGHTDTAGSSSKNDILALKRARVVANIIKNSNIHYLKMVSKSHSEFDLAIKTEDETIQPLNRRVEIFVY